MRRPLDTATIGTAALAVASAAIASYYAVSEPKSSAKTLSVVRYVYEAAEPLWPLVFGVVAVALVVTTLVRHYRRATHIVTTGAFVAYSVALWFGVFSTSPPGSWVSASFALALAINAFGLTRYHARETAWTQR